MTPTVAFGAVALVSAGALALVALFPDWVRREIPHWLVCALALLWVATVALVPDAPGVSAVSVVSMKGGLVCAAGALAIGFPLHAWGALGGGDVKLLAALALWLGPQDLGPALLGSALIGLLLVAAGLAGRSADFAVRGVPFAWAIAPPAATLLFARAAAIAGG